MILMAFEMLAITICCAIFFAVGFQCGKANQKSINNDSVENGQFVNSELDSDLSKILNYTGDYNRD